MSALAKPRRYFSRRDWTDEDSEDYPGEWQQVLYHRRRGTPHRVRRMFRRDNELTVDAVDRMLKVAFPAERIEAMVNGPNPLLEMINRCVDRDVEAQKLYEEARMLYAAAGHDFGIGKLIKS